MGLLVNESVRQSQFFTNLFCTYLSLRKGVGKNGHRNFNIKYLNIFSYTTDAPLKLNHGPVLHIRRASSPYWGLTRSIVWVISTSVIRVRGHVTYLQIPPISTFRFSEEPKQTCVIFIIHKNQINTSEAEGSYLPWPGKAKPHTKQNVYKILFISKSLKYRNYQILKWCTRKANEKFTKIYIFPGFQNKAGNSTFPYKHFHYTPFFYKKHVYKKPTLGWPTF